MSGNRSSCIAAISGFNDPAKIFQGRFSLADFYQSTYDGPDHIPEEAVGFDGEYQLPAGVFPIGLMYMAEIGFDVCM